MTTTEIKHERIRLAIVNMRLARVQLRKAGANKAADAVARALKSVEGAQRHAFRMAFQESADSGYRIFTDEQRARIQGEQS